ncbi:MAG: aminomethyl-transferring glycine dehydrogenase subunit GcvPB [Oscillospiraceae bacterium]|jgi:glycine dehydrogenase subunit 2
MELLFEKGGEGRRSDYLPVCDVPAYEPKTHLRAAALDLPQLSEVEVDRHYEALSRRAYGVCDGFYPLGSCTMKYNPAVNEDLAALPGFSDIHPLQPAHTVQGCLNVLRITEKYLSEITGMDGFTFQPAAGAHGEFTGLLMIKAYHRNHGDGVRTKIIVPDSAHGTNPASAAMAGFSVVNISSGPDGCVDLDALRAAVGPDTAGLMLTNPNTVGLFDRNILEITRIVHEAGGLCYYDGANLNAIMGVARPGDMGFDVMHLNLHKTFSTPHGGGGPGSGPVGCKESLLPYLPGIRVREEKGVMEALTPECSIGSVRGFNGNFLVVVRALAYLLTLGRAGVQEAAINAVLNANYMRVKLADDFDMAYDHTCMHEFVISLQKLKDETGVSALDAAKGLLDLGIHPPTMYFPLIVHEALMLEPTETETKETLDAAIEALRTVRKMAETDPETLHQSPRTAVIGRPDEVEAARHPVIRWQERKE